MATAKELGDLIGVTDRMVYHLAREGIIPKRDKHKGYVLRDCVQSYIKHLRDAKRTGSDDPKSLADERTRNERLKADLRELELALKREEVLETEPLLIAMTNMLGLIKTRLLALDKKMAPALQQCKTTAEYADVITDHVSDVLTALSLPSAIKKIKIKKGKK